jgi:branched-chain amino acid transport system ATP-binding protein
MLDVSDLSAWYGESHVLHGVAIHIEEGEVVALLGRNGAGKSTTLRAVMGLVSKCSGTVSFRGADLSGCKPNVIARSGIAYCPEDRGIFASLTVAENLMLPPQIAKGGVALEQIDSLFPNLRLRASSRGTELSGGEQQMLAIARILRTGAKLLLLDEPTEGLAPVIIQHIARTIREIKKLGYTILVVEQNSRFVQGIADRHYIMDHGTIVDELSGPEFATQIDRVNRYLGL